MPVTPMEGMFQIQDVSSLLSIKMWNITDALIMRMVTLHGAQLEYPPQVNIEKEIGEIVALIASTHVPPMEGMFQIQDVSSLSSIKMWITMDALHMKTVTLHGVQLMYPLRVNM